MLTMPQKMAKKDLRNRQKQPTGKVLRQILQTSTEVLGGVSWGIHPVPDLQPDQSRADAGLTVYLDNGQLHKLLGLNAGS